MNTSDAPPFENNEPLFIGGVKPTLEGQIPWSSGSRTFKGMIDEVRISEGLRYPFQLRAVKINPERRFKDDSKTIALWHFDKILWGKRLAELDRGNAREYYSRIARSYMRIGDLDSAMKMAREVIAHSPRNPEGYRLAAEIAGRKGDYKGAIDNLKQAVRLRPESTELRRDLAEICVKAGDYRLAIEQYWRWTR